MNPQDPLSQLQPLREPELVGWWPLAPGWWFLIVLAAAALLAAAIYVCMRYRRNAYRRQALRQLDKLAAAHAADNDDAGLACGINALLKAVALVSFPKNVVAPIHGQEWLEFLQSTSEGKVHFEANFADAVYRQAPDLNATRLVTDARTWITQHGAAA